MVLDDKIKKFSLKRFMVISYDFQIIFLEETKEYQEGFIMMIGALLWDIQILEHCQDFYTKLDIQYKRTVYLSMSDRETRFDWLEKQKTWFRPDIQKYIYII